MDKTTKITGKPKFMKELNISEIKRAILKNPMITRSNIASLTNISLTTVGNILTELIRNEDIFTGGYEESSGGRKAEKYYFNKEKYQKLRQLLLGDKALLILLIFIILFGIIRNL